MTTVLIHNQFRNVVLNAGHVLRNSPASTYAYAQESFKYYANDPLQLSTEVLSGMAVGIMQVPESIAFAFIAQIPPLRGLYSTFFIGLFAAAFGGRPGMVSGIAGSMVVVQKDMQAEMRAARICETERLDLLYLSIIFCGLFEILLGSLQIYRLFLLLPQTIAIGFVNGLAIIIFISQLGAFQVEDLSITDFRGEPDGCPAPSEFPGVPQKWLMLDQAQTWRVLLLIFIVLAIMFLQPRIKQSFRFGRLVINSQLVPPSLTAMVVATFIEHVIFRGAFNVSTKIVGDVAKLSGTLPMFYIPRINASNPLAWMFVLKYAAILAAVSITEALLTLQLITVYMKKRLKPNNGFQELLAQGIGCIVSGLFQSIGGTTMIGQTTVNLLNGSKNRLAGVLASFFILLLIAFAGPAIELLPIACLGGILFVVVIHTFEWKIFKYFWRRQAEWTDYFTIILVTVLAVSTNLAYALVAGLIWSVLIFALQSSTSLIINRLQDDVSLPPSIIQALNKSDYESLRCLQIKPTGLLFFGSVRQFTQEILFMIRNEFKSTSDIDLSLRVVVIDLQELVIFDFSAIDGLKQVSMLCSELGLQLYLLHINEHNRVIMARHSKLKHTLVSDDEVDEIEIDNVDKQEIAHQAIGMLEGQDEHPVIQLADRNDQQPENIV